MRLVVVGLVAGNVVGLTLMALQARFHLVPLDPEMYYLSSVPVEFQPLGIVLLNAGILLASWLILAVPARTAAAVDPASAIKYE